MKKLKINPIWLAFFTFWVPHTITGFSLPEVPKMVLIWLIVAFQIYWLYLGIEKIKKERKD